MQNNSDHSAALRTILEIVQTHPTDQLVGSIIGKVTLKSELFEDANTTCFYFNLRDNSSVSVNVRSFDALAKELHPQIQIGQTYFITNFLVVKKALGDIEFVLTADSIIRPCTIPGNYAIPIQRKFLSNIIQNGKKGEYFNVLVALHRVKTPLHEHEFNDGTKCKRIDLFVRDESDCIVTLILWRLHAENYAQNAQGPNPILFLKQAQLFNVKGYLTTRQSTVLNMNPQFKETLALKNWMITQNHQAFGFDLVDEPKVGLKRKRREEEDDDDCSGRDSNDSDESDTTTTKAKRRRVDMSNGEASSEESDTVMHNNNPNSALKEYESTQNTTSNLVSSLFVLVVMTSLFISNNLYC